MNKLISYETPYLTVYQLHSEGTLCQSIDGVYILDLEYDGDEVLGC